MQVSSAGHRGYRFGVFTLDLDRGALLERGKEVNLRPKSFDVLCCLVKHHGTLLTREELLSAVWPDVVVTDDSLTQCLMEIRRTLGDHDRSLIRTVPRRGFIFEPAVEPLPAGRTTAARRLSRPRWLLAALAALLLAVVAGWIYSPAPEPHRVPLESPATVTSLSDNAIAVLDFDDMSPNKDRQWFAQGLSEEIRNLLASTRDLKVIGRSSSAAVGMGDSDLRAIGRLLGVRHLLEGSVRQTGDRVRISVQLIDSGNGVMTWSESYDGSMNQLFALQDEVATAVLDALKQQIGGYPSRGRPTQNADAYALFLKARLALNSQDSVTAEADLRRAVELDPEFAEAWELLAHTYWTEPQPGLGVAETRALIRDAARNALMVDPSRDFARALFIESNSDAALTAGVLDAYARAAETQPTNPSILRMLSWNLILAGYLDEGLAAARRHVETDPLSSVAHVRYSAALSASGKDAESLAALQAADRLSDVSMSWYVGEKYLSNGNEEQAIANFSKALNDWGIVDTARLKEVLNHVKQGIPYADGEFDELRLALHALPPDRERFVTTGLNRWLLFTGNLDPYFEIILDSVPQGRLSPQTEHYVWYGVLYRDSGFTAHPLYIAVARLLGLIEIWEQRGAPDFCSKQQAEWVCF